MQTANSKRLWRYFGLAFAISWGIWIPLGVYEIDNQALFWIAGFGPSLAAVILLVLAGGWTGAWAELKRLFVDLATDGRVNAIGDMSKVSFLDSTVLGTLVWGMKNLREREGDFRMFGLHDFLRRLFEITQLDRAFRIFDSESDAITSYE